MAAPFLRIGVTSVEPTGLAMSEYRKRHHSLELRGSDWRVFYVLCALGVAATGAVAVVATSAVAVAVLALH
jgi:hypothetical protein